RATIAFMKPCVSSVASVRNTRFIGNLATRIPTPSRCASRSLKPTCASCGSVNMQYGTSRPRAFVSSSQVLPNNAEIIAGYMGELRAAGTISHRPHTGSASLQPIVDADEAAPVQCNAGLVEPDILRVRRTTRRHQNVAALDLLLAGRRAYAHPHVL